MSEIQVNRTGQLRPKQVNILKHKNTFIFNDY